MKLLKNGELPSRTKKLAIDMIDRYNQFHAKRGCNYTEMHKIECFFLSDWGYISWAIKEGLVKATFTRENKSGWSNPTENLMEIINNPIKYNLFKK